MIDTIVDTKDQLQRLGQVLSGFDVFFVGVHCPLPELEHRERQRGDRNIGDARRDFEIVHTFSTYDMEVNSSLSPQQNARQIIESWNVRKGPGVFDSITK